MQGFLVFHQSFATMVPLTTTISNTAMPKVQPNVESFARIKVIGVGGSGSNAINHMIESGVKNVEFIAMNTDTQDLHHSDAHKKIHIGKNLTKGIGSGMNPDIGRQSAEETKAEILEAFKGADMAFIACGMGGGTGTGATPVVARIAKEQGVLTIGVVTKPFNFEGQERRRIAEKGLEDLEKELDALIVIPNDRLAAIADKETSFKDAFKMCDEILRQAVESISELITTPGIINIDYADIKAVLTNAGPAFMGIGKGSGEDRAQEAVMAAINSPLLEIKMAGAKRVLFAISGGDDLTMHEVQDIAHTISEYIDGEAKVIFGAIHDDKLKKGEIKVTIVASGFDANNPSFKRNLFGTQTPEPRRELRVETTKKETPVIEEIDLEEEGEDWNSGIPAFLRRGKK